MFHWPQQIALDQLRRRRAWPVFGQLWQDVHASRVIIFAIVIVTYLLHSGQGEELTASLVLVPSSRSWLLFFSIAMWAAQTWLWSRLAIVLRRAEPDAIRGPLSEKLLPVILSVAVFLVALEPFVRAEKTGVISLIGISCFCMFLGAAALIRSPNAADGPNPFPLTLDRGTGFSGAMNFILDVRRQDRAGFSVWRRVILLSLAASLAGALLGGIFALQFGKLLGTLGTVFLASSILLPFLAVAAICARRTDFPILWGVLLAPFLLPTLYSRLLNTGWTAALASAVFILVSGLYFVRHRFVVALATLVIGGSLAYLSYRDSAARLGIPHEVVRMTPDRPIARCKMGEAEKCISSLPEEIDAWVDAAAPEVGKTNYVVFVAAAGGGLRAAYWTASVLARLTDCVPTFRKRLFAISGVSGGSLGAGLYAALLRDRKASEDPRGIHCPDHPITILDPPALKSGMQGQLSDFLEQDFLAPVTASLLFRDLPQGLMPVQLIPDRAAILASAFDQAWSDACASRPVGAECGNPDQFGASFFDVKDPKAWTPILLFNGTHEETGKRVITSRIRIDQGTFSDAFDFFDLLNSDISLSTSVMNSARFPIVSPAGALIRSDLRRSGHIIDGGFFENNGATTLQEIMAATLTYLDNKYKAFHWRPLVIEIVNDVEEQEADLARSKNELFPKPADEPLELTSKPYDEVEFANELFGAVTGLYATRTARGILASKMLSDAAVTKDHGEFAQFRLCPHMRPSPPLGWLLTADSRKAMDQIILGIGRSGYQRQYAGYLDARAMSEYRNCFDDVQQSLIVVQSHLSH